MKRSLCRIIVIVSIFTILVVPLQVARADDYVHHIDVYIDRVTHYGGVVYHNVTKIVKHYTIHIQPPKKKQKKHKHPSPSVTPHFTDVNCGLSPSQCDHCH